MSVPKFGIAALATSLRRRTVSSVELARSAIDGLERTGRSLNAVEAILAERALTEAAAADRALRRGGDRSPLLGIPYGAKDNIAAVGASLTAGSDLFRGVRPKADADVIAALKRSGSVLIAKLAMIELAGAGGYRYASASHRGATRNPRAPDRWSGGSSSGSAAAVAAGLLPFTLGSETGGSMALPSAFCGVTSIRPTYGLVSRRGCVPLSWSLDKIGPMATSARDVALVLDAIADPAVGRAATGARRRGAGGARHLRIGVVDTADAAYEDAETRRALEAGLHAFIRVVGPRPRRVTLPRYPYDAMLTTIYFAEGASVFAPEIRSPRLRMVRDPFQRAGLRAALDIRAVDYLQAMRLRVPVRDAFRDLFGDVDALLCVARTRTATKIDEPRVGRSGRRGTMHFGSVELIAAGNLIGLPAVYFPCGMTRAGLPVGLQLVGPHFSEGRLLAAVERFQREVGA